MSTPTSPLIHLVDDDDAVRDALALLIGTVGLRVQAWPDPLHFIGQFDRDSIGERHEKPVAAEEMRRLAVLDTLVQ